MNPNCSEPAGTSLTGDNWTGPWAGLPVAWTDRDAFDEATYRAAVTACCRAGVPGVYTGGTTGEFYAMEFDEFQQVARATIEECRSAGKPAMIGCTSTYTLGAIRRARFAAELGAAAVQIALPFWMEVADDQIVPFFREVAKAAGGLPLSIYETTRSKKVLALQQHREIKEAVPNYLMVKANAGTLGCTSAGCQALSEFVNVFVGEHQWSALGTRGRQGELQFGRILEPGARAGSLEPGAARRVGPRRYDLCALDRIFPIPGFAIRPSRIYRYRLRSSGGWRAVSSIRGCAAAGPILPLRQTMYVAYASGIGSTGPRCVRLNRSRTDSAGRA